MDYYDEETFSSTRSNDGGVFAFQFGTWISKL